MSMGQLSLCERLDGWYDRLALWCHANIRPPREADAELLLAGKLEVRKLVRWTSRCLTAFRSPADCDGARDAGFCWKSRLSVYQYLLAQCLSACGDGKGAINALQYAARLDPKWLPIREALIGEFLKAGRFRDAATEANRIPLRLLASKDDSSAHVFLDWALEHDEFAARLRPHLVKRCVLLAARDCHPLAKPWRYALVKVLTSDESARAVWWPDGLYQLEGVLVRRPQSSGKFSERKPAAPIPEMPPGRSEN
jgi:hypothetical protein